MIAAWILGGLTTILVALYMARPRLENRRLSAAQFFQDLESPRQQTLQLRLSNPLLARPFYLQLLALLIILVAVLTIHLAYAGAGTEQSIGLWLMVDTSGSMSTEQEDELRLTLAQEAALDMLDIGEQAAQNAVSDIELCVKLSAFDLDSRALLTTANLTVVAQEIESLPTRALGTNIDLVRSALEGLIEQRNVDLANNTLEGLTEQRDAECVITHLAVFTDLPAPEWIADHEAIQTFWHDVSESVDNIGFTDLRATRNPLTGLVHQVSVTVQAYNSRPSDARIEVTSPTGETVLNDTLRWEGDGTWQARFKPVGPGEYRLQITPGGAYPLDDEAVITISDGDAIRVDWQVERPEFLSGLGWIQDAVKPQFRITANVSSSDVSNDRAIPTLIIGDGYTADNSNEILDFFEASPLLADLNFDVAETIGIRGIPLPSGSVPVLRGLDEQAWIATDSRLPTVYIPDLPVSPSATDAQDETLVAFSNVVFFNAVRWLLQERTLPPLYTLTSASAPEAEGNRIALHDAEGNTERVASSYGELTDLKPIRVNEREEPIWPILLTVAAAIFCIERSLAAYGGAKWR
ncbi:MAG: hypothetical protein AAF702_40710 [Chloroflexota bacterium]